MNYSQFIDTHPLLGNRLHTLHCESCKPMGVSLSINYTGTQTDGKGEMFVTKQYGGEVFKFSVKNGIIRAFGLTQDMRKPTEMKLHGSAHFGITNYGETGDQLL